MLRMRQENVWGGVTPSVDKELLGKVHKVVGVRHCSACLVHVRLHAVYTVVCLLLGQVLEGTDREREKKKTMRNEAQLPTSLH